MKNTTKAKVTKTAKTKTGSKPAKITIPVPPTLTVAPAAIKVQVKQVQTVVGKRNVSKLQYNHHTPSRLTDLIVAPSHAEFKILVCAIPTGNRFEFKNNRGYVFYPVGYRAGAPSKPRIITWVKGTPAINQ